MDLLAVTNWWPWCSRASIGSALERGYQVHVIVSDCQNDPPAEPFLDRMRRRFPNRVHFSRDHRPRDNRVDHCCTRYDYLPEIMERHQLPTLVTDADVIHRDRLNIPDNTDVAFGHQPASPMPRIEESSEGTGMPLIWCELALWAWGGITFFAPTEGGFAFARRIQMFIEDMRTYGLAHRFAADQLAVLAATRRLDGVRVHRLNQRGCEDICSDPAHGDHPIWLPYRVERDDWLRAAETYANGPPLAIDF